MFEDFTSVYNGIRSRHYSDIDITHVYSHGFTLIPTWISNHIPSKVLDEITYLFPNFVGATVEDWEWICNFIPNFIMDLITYPCWSSYRLSLRHWIHQLLSQNNLQKVNINTFKDIITSLVNNGNAKVRFDLICLVDVNQIYPRSICMNHFTPWWRHEMETFSALLAICAGNSPVTGEFPAQKPVTRSFDVLFDLRLNKRLGKQSRD